MKPTAEELRETITVAEDEEIETQYLYHSIADFVRIGEQTGRTIPRDEFDTLSIKQKVIISLLTEIAKCRMEILPNGASRHLDPAEMAAHTKSEIGVIYPEIRELERANIITRSDGGEYTIYPEQFDDARNLLPEWIFEDET